MKNIRLKVFLENNVLPLFSKLNSIKKHSEDRVLLYINSNFRENNEALFDYMLKNGYNQKFKIIVSCYDYKKYKDKENVKFIDNKKAFFEFFRAKYVFYSIGRIPLDPAPDQIVMQMWHGVPLKNPDEGLKKTHCFSHQHYTWLLSTSEFLKPVFSKWMSVPVEKMYVGGYPRCDRLFNKEKKYDFGDYKKLILWTPTFRKSYIRGYSDANMGDRIVPILHDKDFSNFNSLLKSIGVKVIVKLHPAQDLCNYHNIQMSNFLIYSHEEFQEKSLDLYYIASQSDALITDYSSIFFDYLLLNRPIGFTEDDMEEYGSTRGFVFDNPQDYMPGMKIVNYDNLCDFVNSIALEEDSYTKERQRINELVNDYREGGYSKRILDFVGIHLSQCK